MARDFVETNPDFIENTSPLLSDTDGGEPFSMACWGNFDDLNATYVLMFYGLDDVGNKRHQLNAFSSDNLQARTVDGASVYNAESAGTLTAGTWHHCGGVWSATNDRRVYLDGTADTNTDTHSMDFTQGTTTAAIGQERGSSPAGAMNGKIAEAAWWSAALTSDDMAMLAAGYSPLFVKPDSLVHYCPLIGRTSPEIDIVGGGTFTLSGTPTVADHPRIIYPSSLVVGVPTAATTGGMVFPRRRNRLVVF